MKDKSIATQSLAGVALAVALGTFAGAEEKHQVAIVNMGPGPVYSQRDNPPCSTGMDFVKMFQDPKRVSALTGGDAKATATVVGTAEVLDKIRSFGGDVAGLVTTQSNGDRAACETACIALPEGARILEIRVSNRTGNEVGSYKRDGDNPHDKNAPTVLKHGGVLNAGPTGDHAGWEGVQVHNGARAVCGTAKNWSHDTGSHQVLRVIYEQ